MRFMYYQKRGTIPKMSKDDHIRISMGQSGTDRHLRIQRAIAKMQDKGVNCEWLSIKDYVDANPELGLTVEKESGLETLCRHYALNLSFKCDGLIRYKGKLYILEIKTESLYKWVTRQAPAEEHLKQVACYALVFNIPDVLFIYENRDSCDKKVFHLVHTPEDILGVKKIIDTCNKYVEDKVSPPKCTDKRGCGWCIYQKTCKGDK
jgi:CRISPR/Cas system-associated exonuclease Cas4 (RecB family)